MIGLHEFCICAICMTRILLQKIINFFNRTMEFKKKFHLSMTSQYDITIHSLVYQYFNVSCLVPNEFERFD